MYAKIAKNALQNVCTPQVMVTSISEENTASIFRVNLKVASVYSSEMVTTHKPAQNVVENQRAAGVFNLSVLSLDNEFLHDGETNFQKNANGCFYYFPSFLCCSHCSIVCCAASQSSSVSSVTSGGRRATEPSETSRGPSMMFGRQSSTATQNGEDTEDTMKNLRKTFAGIFGDMQRHC